MSTPVTFNGSPYSIPSFNDTGYAQGPGNLSTYLVALASGTLQPTGGSFPLTADINFGTNFGLIAKYYTSVTANPSHTGALRLSKTDAVGWRNNANSADLLLQINGSDQLEFNGVTIGPPAVLSQNNVYVGNASNQPANVPMSGDVGIVDGGATTIQAGVITDAKVNATAGIAVTKLAALTANQAVATDSSGFLTPSTTTDTELGYVQGVTSSIQAQINSITAAGTFVAGDLKAVAYSTTPSGWLLCDGSAVNRTTFSALFAAIGTTWGPGDGSTTFNIPNAIDNVLVGAGTIAALGVSAGASTHVISGSELPTHNHAITDPGHSHTLSVNFVNGATSGQFGWQDATLAGLATPTPNATGSSGAGVTVNNAGSSTAMSLVQPVIGVRWLIKT